MNGNRSFVLAWIVCVGVVLGLTSASDAASTSTAVAPAESESQPVREQPAPTLTLSDIVSLSEGGVSDDVIEAQIRASGQSFVLSAREILDLRRQGVSNTVLAALVRTGVEKRQADAEEWLRRDAERPRVIVRVDDGFGWSGYDPWRWRSRWWGYPNRAWGWHHGWHGSWYHGGHGDSFWW